MSTSRIDKLIAQKAQIDAQLKAARAREREKKRKEDNRRKIIAGALALKHAEKNPDSEFTRTMLKLIQDGVTTDRERALFDLDPLPSPQDNTPSSTPKRTLWDRATRKK